MACVWGCSLPFSAPPAPLTDAGGEPLLKPAGAPGASAAAPPDVSGAKATVDSGQPLPPELAKLEHLDETTKRQVAADLEKVPRALWPYVLLYYQDQAQGTASQQLAGRGELTPHRMAPRKSEPTFEEALAKAREREAAQQPAEATKAPAAAPNQAAFISDLAPAAPPVESLLQQPTSGAAQIAQLAALAQSSAAAAADAQPLGWREHLQAAIAQLERQSAASGSKAEDLEPKLRLLYLAADRGPDALEPCASLGEGEQQFWTEELFGLHAALDQSVSPVERRHTLAARHLRQAATHLGQQGLLDVRSAAFCSRVDSYGIYKRLNTGPDEFRPGQETLLYAEVENFSSEARSEGFHTSLASRYEIANDRGEIVARHEFPPLEEICANQRRDFFIQHHMQVPKGLPVGRYRLRLVLTDVHARKQGEALLPFAIRGE
ncbi:MAG: hypothetical protein U0836_21500 [Pirellulales bacterium]